MILITRLGSANVSERLPPLIDAVRAAGRTVLWVCDPMHGNTVTTDAGVKTRRFEDIQRELAATFEVHADAGRGVGASHGSPAWTGLGGVHFELTGDDVTECVGGGSGVEEAHLARRYTSLCDPRLNYQQSLEIAFELADHLARRP